jgi:magnesium-transporting ATPase (P-type)
VTGDFGFTAAAIARSIGIFTNTTDPDTIKTITEQDGLSDPDLDSEKDSFYTQSTRTSLLLEGPSISDLRDDD